MFVIQHHDSKLYYNVIGERCRTNWVEDIADALHFPDEDETLAYDIIEKLLCFNSKLHVHEFQVLYFDTIEKGETIPPF